MWHHEYALANLRLAELRADADRARRWRLQDADNGRSSLETAPGRVRASAARLVAAASRGAARTARRLDGRVTLDPGTERLLRNT